MSIKSNLQYLSLQTRLRAGLTPLLENSREQHYNTWRSLEFLGLRGFNLQVPGSGGIPALGVSQCQAPEALEVRGFRFRVYLETDITRPGC